VLNALGWEVVRYWNEEILEDPQKVADEISKTIELRRG
jgi:very-short-patch-repair endonuclease